MYVKEFNHIKVEKNEENNYAVISINRPDKLNALATETLQEIADALEAMVLKKDIRCVVLRGTKDFTKKPAFSFNIRTICSPQNRNVVCYNLW